MSENSYTVNCSTVFRYLPMLERPAAARAAGFSAVEFWWPFEDPTPEAAEIEDFVAALKEADVRLTGLNFFGGDMPAGDRGAVSVPALEEQFTANLDVITRIGELTGCRSFNALYGNAVKGYEPAVLDELAVRNLSRAAQAVGRIGGTVLLEPLSGAPDYPLKKAADAVAVLDRLAAAGAPGNVAVLLDLFHLAVGGDDVPAAIRDHGSRCGHVQIADSPGRGAPGTGELPLGTWLDQLRDQGYVGYVGLEHLGEPDDSFGQISLKRL